mgnify:FL=1
MKSDMRCPLAVEPVLIVRQYINALFTIISENWCYIQVEQRLVSGSLSIVFKRTYTMFQYDSCKFNES